MGIKEFKGIFVISGYSGLFKYISQGRNAEIVENLGSLKRTIIPSTTKIIMLDEVSVFTKDGKVPLRNAFRKIQSKESGGAAISHKSPNTLLKQYFEEVLPEYDKDMVHVSDIRKIVMWYNQLHKLGYTDFEEEEAEIAEETIVTSDMLNHV